MLARVSVQVEMSRALQAHRDTQTEKEMEKGMSMTTQTEYAQLVSEGEQTAEALEEAVVRERVLLELQRRRNEMQSASASAVTDEAAFEGFLSTRICKRVMQARQAMANAQLQTEPSLDELFDERERHTKLV